MMNDEDLLKKLQTDNIFNPWLCALDDWSKALEKGESSVDYVLDADKMFLSNETKIEFKYQLRTDILPQPFVGNPMANVWVLMHNPGLRALDYYDLVSTENWASYQKRLEDRDWHPILPEQLYFKDPQEAKEKLRARQKRVINQFKFDFLNSRGTEFYLLDDCFRTYDRPEQDRKIYGGRHWYENFFCTREFMSDDCSVSTLERVSKNLFVLDYCPYRSCYYQERKTDFVHVNLWKQLVKHALSSKKIIIRGADILGKVRCLNKELYERAVEDCRVFVFSGQNAWLTIQNLSCPCSKKQFKALWS